MERFAETMGWSQRFASLDSNVDITIGVIGLGYVGLPTAIGFHDAGFTVWGVDVSQRTVDMIKAGKTPTGDPDGDDIVPQPGSERWHITTSTAEAVPQCDVVLVTVPTPITNDLKPDLSYVEVAGKAVFESIPRGSNIIVVLESTVYPGVTAQTWLPLIELDSRRSSLAWFSRRRAIELRFLSESRPSRRPVRSHFLSRA